MLWICFVVMISTVFITTLLQLFLYRYFTEIVFLLFLSEQISYININAAPYTWFLETFRKSCSALARCFFLVFDPQNVIFVLISVKSFSSSYKRNNWINFYTSENLFQSLNTRNPIKNHWLDEKIPYSDLIFYKFKVWYPNSLS